MPRKSLYAESFKNKTNYRLVEEYIKHRELGKPILNKAKKPIGDKTAKKIRIWLKNISAWLDKDFKVVHEKDIDSFRQKLKDDKFLQNNGKPFSIATKRDIEYKLLRPFMQWLGKRDIVEFVCQYNEQKEIPAIKKDDLIKLLNASKIREKVIFAILFDGGLRAEEFLNLTWADLKDDQRQSGGFYKVRVTKSKTKPRTIHLWMDETSEALDGWISINKDKIGTNQPLVKLSYPHFLNTIKRQGLRVLKIHLHPHLLRHSSATHYCHKLNQYQMCKRYGWAMGSKMPQVYIDREGIEMEELSEKITNDNAIIYRKEVNQLREQNNILQEQMFIQASEMEKQMTEMQNALEVLQLAGFNPEKIKAALQKK